jgi:hypothetical protein
MASVELSDGTERYSAVYLNLRLEVHLCARGQARVFEFRVLDLTDGGTLWVGERLDLQSAQTSALSEARSFVAESALGAPQWHREFQ